MQEWEDPLRFNLDLRLLQRQGHNQPTDRPTDRPSALTPKKKKKKKKKKKSYCLDIRSTHALLCSFSFFEWGFVVKFVSLFFILDWSVIPWRKLSRRLADAKIKPPRCWDPNRWLFRDFPTFTVCFLSSSDASRILCSLPCNSVTTARIRAVFLLDLLHLSTFSLFFFLFLLPSFAGNASACVCVCVCVCVCHTELESGFQQVLRSDHRAQRAPAGFFSPGLTVFLWILQQVWCHWSASPRENSPRRASCWTA